MGNHLNVIPTQFIDSRSGNISYGWRAYDDYWTEYSNMWTSIPDDDDEFLRLFFDEAVDGDLAQDSVSFHIREKGGFWIDKTWITSEYAERIIREQDHWVEAFL